MSSSFKSIAVALFCACVGVAAQTGGTVKVTVARANIRSEPNEKAPILMQAVSGAAYELKSVEGDWFRIQLVIGSVRAEGFISKKVSTLVSAAATKPATTASAPATAVDGMSVALLSGELTSWLVPHRAQPAVWRDRQVVSIADLASMAIANEPSPVAGASAATYVWLVDGAASVRVLPDRQPVFVVRHKDDAAPAIVKLGRSFNRRVVAAAHGRADERARGDADWDLLGRELRQDLVRAVVEPVDHGVKLRPAADLEPGEYAVVIRPVSKKKVAGASALSADGEGRVFSLVWDFAIK
jgi:hypothetical protein